MDKKERTSFCPLPLSGMTIYQCITDCAADLLTHVQSFTDKVKYAAASSFKKLLSQFPILIIPQPKSGTLQTQLDELFVYLSSLVSIYLQILVVDLMKRCLLSANHILPVMGHHNTAWDILTYYSFTKVWRRSYSASMVQKQPLKHCPTLLLDWEWRQGAHRPLKCFHTLKPGFGSAWLVSSQPWSACMC